MIDKNAKIFLTYSLGGKYITKRGEYSVAKLSGGVITTPSKTLEQPEYAECTMRVVLNNAFIERALSLPECPYKRNSGEYHWWLKSDMGKLLLDYKNLTDEQKIQRHVEIYVKDITGISELIKGEDYNYDLVMEDNEEED